MQTDALADTESSSANSSSRQRPHVAAVFTGLLILLGAFYWRPLSGQADFYVSDASYFFEPLCRFVREQIQHGHFPLWNPLLYCGMPQLAVPSPGLLYLPSYFMFLLPFSQGLSLFMIFHQLLLAVGAYLVAKSWKLSNSAALVLATASGLAAYNFSVCRNPTLLASAAWLFVALFFQNKVDGTRSIRQSLFLISTAVCSSACIYGGRPEVFLGCEALIFINCFSDGLKSFFQTGKLSFSRADLLRLIAFIAGLFLAAPQIVPTLEWSVLSPRAEGLQAKDCLTWSSNTYDFLAMILSYPIGDPCLLSNSASVIQNIFLSKDHSIPFLSSSYVGPIILCLAIYALTDKTHKYRIHLLALLIVSTLLAAGENTPLLPALLKLCPPLSLIRYPVKLLIFPTLLLNILAALGLDSVINKRESRRSVLICLGASIILLLLGTAGSLSFLTFFGQQYLSTAYGDSIRSSNQLLSANILTCGAIGLAVNLATYLHSRSKINGAWYSSAILSGIGLSLFLSSASFQYLTQSNFYTEESKLFTHLNQFLDEDKRASGVSARVLPYYTEAMSVGEKFDSKGRATFEEKYYAYSRNLGRGNSTIDFGTPQSYGYEAAAGRQIAKFASLSNQYSSQYIVGNHPLAVSDIPLHRLCKITASNFVLTQTYLLSKEIPLPQLDDKLFELFGKSLGNNSRIYRVINPRQRIHFASKIELDNSLDETLQKLCDPNERDEDQLNSEFLLDNEHNRKLKQTVDSNANQTSDGASKFTLVKDSADEIVISVVASKDELMVLSDSYYPGWTARVDGQETSIVQANLINRAVAVPKGQHEIRFHYFPQSLITGIVLAVVAFVVLILASTLPLKAQRTKSGDTATNN